METERLARASGVDPILSGTVAITTPRRYSPPSNIHRGSALWFLTANLSFLVPPVLNWISYGTYTPGY